MSAVHKLVVGLGNPGAEYEDTRHNLGWLILDRFAKESGYLDWESHSKFKSELTRQGGTLLVKPQTYMNHSGEAVAKLCQFYKLTPSQLLIVSDDIDLPLGTIRFRAEGGSGGQKGLAGIITAVGSHEIPRLRVGINRPQRDAAEHVLSTFTEEERRILESEVLPHVLEMLKKSLES